jgi:predicted RNA binding protein YcfA (HicA-like mRNA interferase family)
MKSGELLKILKQNGWYVVRQSGSHMILRHPSQSNQIVFPNHPSQEIGKGLASKILKKSGNKK